MGRFCGGWFITLMVAYILPIAFADTHLLKMDYAVFTYLTNKGAIRSIYTSRRIRHDRSPTIDIKLDKTEYVGITRKYGIWLIISSNRVIIVFALLKYPCNKRISIRYKCLNKIIQLKFIYSDVFKWWLLATRTPNWGSVLHGIGTWGHDCLPASFVVISMNGE